MLEHKTLLKHDRYVDDLCVLISGRYETIERHIFLYSKRKRLVAEIDVIACNGPNCDIYEVKCSLRFAKAKRQLFRIKKLLSHKVRNTYFFCGESKTIYTIGKEQSSLKPRLKEEELSLPPLRHPPWEKRNSPLLLEEQPTA